MLLGCGTVGSGVARLLLESSPSIERHGGAHYRLRAIAVRDAARERDAAIPRALITTSALAAIDDAEVGLVIECIGGIEVAREYVERALRAGKHVVTANKDLLALHGPLLRSLAAQSGASLHYEAAVGGAIPIVRALADSLAGEDVLEVGGVLNGTTNFILSEMSSGASYAGALAEAQRLGFAEADPRADVEGGDAAHKLAILAQLAFGLDVTSDRIARWGISALTRGDMTTAARLSMRLKLIASARKTAHGLAAAVTPAFVRINHPFAEPAGSQNCIRVVGRSSGSLTFSGFGAGGGPTASAVVGDVIAALRRIAVPRELKGPALAAAGRGPIPVLSLRRVISLASFRDVRPASRTLLAAGFEAEAFEDVPVVLTGALELGAADGPLRAALAGATIEPTSIISLWEDSH